METLIKICLYLLCLTYWIFWIGSILLFNVSGWKGILIGVIVWVIHLLILQILYWINGDGWLWNP